MNNPKITIIVPVYNVEQYVRECFDSIAAQTYKGELECIFVDDCGQDKSVEVLEKLMVDYQGNIVFCLVHHEQNKGLSGARNTGIKHATGEYLYFLDSDDTITPDCIERLGALVMRYPGVDVVQGSTMSHLNQWLMLDLSYQEHSADKRWIQRNWPAFFKTAWNKLVSRKLILENHLFFAEGLIHEDDIWNFLLVKSVSSIAFSFDVTYCYRENQTGIMCSQSTKESYMPVIEIMSQNVTAPEAATQIERILSLANAHHVEIQNSLKSIPCNSQMVRLLNWTLKKRGQSKKTLVGISSRVLYRILHVIINMLIR